MDSLRLLTRNWEALSEKPAKRATSPTTARRSNAELPDVREEFPDVREEFPIEAGIPGPGSEEEEGTDPPKGPADPKTTVSSATDELPELCPPGLP